MSGYKTKQKEAILVYIKSLHGQHVTVNQIANHFSETESAIGVTTIYRYLDKLVAEGVVNKYVLDGISGSCFEYIEVEGRCNEYFHFKCEECGKLVHLQCDTLSRLQEHLLASHGLHVNSLKTVFYGKCEECIRY